MTCPLICSSFLRLQQEEAMQAIWQEQVISPCSPQLSVYQPLLIASRATAPSVPSLQSFDNLDRSRMIHSETGNYEKQHPDGRCFQA